jgi:hypothetical protein
MVLNPNEENQILACLINNTHLLCKNGHRHGRLIAAPGRKQLAVRGRARSQASERSAR